MNLIAAAVVLVLGTLSSLTFWSTAYGLGRVADTLFDALVGNGNLLWGALWVLGSVGTGL